MPRRYVTNGLGLSRWRSDPAFLGESWNSQKKRSYDLYRDFFRLPVRALLSVCILSLEFSFGATSSSRIFATSTGRFRFRDSGLVVSSFWSTKSVLMSLPYDRSLSSCSSRNLPTSSIIDNHLFIRLILGLFSEVSFSPFLYIFYNTGGMTIPEERTCRTFCCRDIGRFWILS